MSRANVRAMSLLHLNYYTSDGETDVYFEFKICTFGSVMLRIFLINMTTPEYPTAWRKLTLHVLLNSGFRWKVCSSSIFYIYVQKRRVQASSARMVGGSSVGINLVPSTTSAQFSSDLLLSACERPTEAVRGPTLELSRAESVRAVLRSLKWAYQDCK